MMETSKNKTVVITGGAYGIGFQIADKFLENGVNLVILLDIDEEKGTEAEKNFNSKYGEAKSEFIKCDVTADLERVSKRIFTKYGTIDVLVNNAGIMNENNLRRTVEINVIALMEWTFVFLEHMRKDKGGKGGAIINMSSLYGFQTVKCLPIYAGSKHAVLGFSKSLGHQDNYNNSGVRVLTLCPAHTASTNLGREQELELLDELVKFMTTAVYQEPDVVGKAAVEIYENAESGTAWLIQDGGPIEKI